MGSGNPLSLCSEQLYEPINAVDGNPLLRGLDFSPCKLEFAGARQKGVLVVESRTAEMILVTPEFGDRRLWLDGSFRSRVYIYDGMTSPKQ